MSTYEKIISLLDEEIDKTLEFGCEILWIKPNLKDTILLKSTCPIEKSYTTHRGMLNEDKNKGDYEILGKPPTILALLRWIEKSKKHTIELDIAGDKLAIHAYIYNSKTKDLDFSEGLTLDLRKEYLRDYSEEELEKILFLMNEILGNQDSI